MLETSSPKFLNKPVVLQPITLGGNGLNGFRPRLRRNLNNQIKLSTTGDGKLPGSGWRLWATLRMQHWGKQSEDQNKTFFVYRLQMLKTTLELVNRVTNVLYNNFQTENHRYQNSFQSTQLNQSIITKHNSGILPLFRKEVAGQITASKYPAKPKLPSQHVRSDYISTKQYIRVTVPNQTLLAKSIPKQDSEVVMSTEKRVFRHPKPLMIEKPESEQLVNQPRNGKVPPDWQLNPGTTGQHKQSFSRPDIENLTDQILQRLQQRTLAQRERLGRI